MYHKYWEENIYNYDKNVLHPKICASYTESILHSGSY